MITYLLQLSLCWILFYAAYHLFLRGETHFSCNRGFLLSAVCLGLVVPLVDWSDLWIHQAESLGNLYIAPFNSQMAEWDITIQATTPQSVGWMEAAVVVYGIGCLIVVIRLMRGWLKILKMRRNSRIESREGYSLALTDQHHMPFSFLGTVYLSKNFYRESPDIDQILAHELYHIRARHSLDIIFLEILQALLWFHPMVYIYKNEIRQLHEYQADKVAYNLTSKKQYGQLLLSHVESGRLVALTNSFFNSQLKNRFIMMTKKPSNRTSLLKYLVMVPLVGMAILIFSYSSHGKTLLMNTIVQQDTLLPPPPPPRLPGIGEEIMLGKERFVVSKDDLFYVDGTKIGYLTQELIDQYEAKGPWVFEIYTTKAAKERLDPNIEANVYSLRQFSHPWEKINKELNPESKMKGEIFRVVEQMPRFSGCEELTGDNKQKKLCADRKMLEFLYANIQYPDVARDHKVEGNVVVSFIVEKDGSITDPKVIRDPGARLGEEALRVVKMMAGLPDKWTPGVQRGQNVRVQFILPIKFELKDKSDNDGDNTKGSIPPPPPPASAVVKGQEEVFRVVEQMPRFPGCEDMEGDNKIKKSCADRKMLEFIYNNVKYPASARDNGIEGNVVVAFTIEKDGSITEPKVIRDPGAGLGEEAIRVVQMMNDLPENWTPGVQQGHDVRVQFILPIKFELATKDENQAKESRALLVIDDEIIGTVDQVELNKTIHVNDVESISVLKGEKAIEKYGTKGSNGVIEITSKWRKKMSGVQLDIANVKIFPVPAGSQLNIEGSVESNGEYRLEIRDLKGSVVRTSEINVFARQIHTNLDLNGLNAGLYYLMVMHQGELFSRAFVKQ